MPRKHSTQRRAARTAVDAHRGASSRTRGSAFGEQVLKLIGDQFGGSRSAMARFLDVGTSHISKWCDDGIQPTAPMLRRIGERTGVSVDSLLGFAEVPRLRAERAEVGSVSRALKEMIEGARPPAAPEMSDAADAAALVEETTRAFWETRRARTAELWEVRLRRLSERLEYDAGRGTGLRDRLMRLRAAQFRKYASTQLTRDAPWEQLRSLENPGEDPSTLIADNCMTKDIVTLGYRPQAVGLMTPYPGLAAQSGVGFAWRGEQIDEAWTVSLDGEVRYERGRRLLIPWFEGTRFSPRMTGYGIRNDVSVDVAMFAQGRSEPLSVLST